MYQTESSISSLKLSLCLVTLWLLASCGFHPVYAKNDQNEGVGDKLAAIKVERVSDELNYYKHEITDQAVQPRRDAQVLETKLISLLNPSGINGTVPAYSLKMKLSFSRRDLGIRGDLRVTRFDVLAQVNYQLIELGTNRLLDEGTVKAKSSFNRTVSELSTFISEENSDELACRELAQEVQERLIYYFSAPKAE